MRIDDVRRLDLGTFVRPPQETGGAPRVEQVLGYAVRTPAGLLVLDTGLGAADDETEAWYRPRRRHLGDALRALGLGLDDVDLVVNCHLHFDHAGGNPAFAGVPIFTQRGELATARAGDYTVGDLIDFAGATYELLDGEAEIALGVHVVPTPGHVDGHQSVVLVCDDGSVVLAGQSHDTASGPGSGARSRTAPAHSPGLDGATAGLRPAPGAVRPRRRGLDGLTRSSALPVRVHHAGMVNPRREEHLTPIPIRPDAHPATADPGRGCLGRDTLRACR